MFLENPEEWELGWLTLVLRDLAEGHLSVGFGTSKGFGRVKFSDWKAKIGFIIPEDFPGNFGIIQEMKTQQSGLYSVLELENTDTDKCEKVYTVAESWVKAFIEKINRYERGVQIYLKNDSYFNDDVFTLYEKEVEING